MDCTAPHAIGNGHPACIQTGGAIGHFRYRVWIFRDDYFGRDRERIQARDPGKGH